MNTHNRVLKTGLLGGLSDADTRRSWPAWVSTHVAECWECRVMIAAVPLLREASQARPGRPAPTVAELRARPQRRVPLAAMVGDLAPFPRGAYRGSGLELDRTATGIQAWDPDARHLMLFAVNGGAVDLLAETCQGTPGVRAEATLPADSTGSVVAIALAEPDDAALWRIFLGQRPEAGSDDEQTDTHVHHFELALRPQREMPTLRLRSSPLPEPASAIAALITQAVDAGEAGREREAMATFTEVRRLGFELGDPMGMARGGIGLGIALFSLGYAEDATEVLTSTITDCELDAHRGGQVCRSLAWLALLGNRLVEGETWARRSEEVQPGSPWIAAIWRHIAFLRADWAELVRLCLESPPEVRDVTAQMRLYQLAIAYSQLGRPAEARQQIADLTEMGELELRVWRLVALACTHRAETGAWAESIESALLGLLAETPRGQISVWEAAPLTFLAMTCERDAPQASAQVLQARFLAGAARNEAPLFAAIATINEVLTVRPDGGFSRLAVRREELVASVAQLRRSVVLDEPSSSSAAALQRLLLPSGHSAGLLVASDGLLAGIPWPWVLAAENGSIPLVTESLGRGAGVFQVPASTRLASLADPLGDLPLARLECSGLGAEVLLRGGEVTSTALDELGEVGLIHLGVHVQRKQGMPELVLADGPMSVIAIGSLKLIGDPIVFLAGCGSASQPRQEGVERSLADAFLRVGASAVVATRWPLSDQEAHEVFRPLLRLWPFSQAEGAVATVTTALRLAGHPPRVWASLATYRA